MAKQKGFLLVTMQPPPALEDEFNEWYDAEHVPERLGVPGFETARRYVCLSGWPRYLAFYDLASPQVILAPEYLRVGGENSSPWTKRVLRSVRGNYRATGAQLHPGQALSGRASRLVLLRFRGLAAAAGPALLAGLKANFAGRPETAQLRLFASGSGGAHDFLALIEARAPYADARLDLAPFGRHAEALDLVNTYAPY
ncbi:MAG: hypothetical protein ACHQF3_12965 [Alphaproteobacteria bacterium]